MAEKLVKIRLTASMAGPGGVYPAGSTLETTPKEAQSLVSNGFAEYITDEVITTESKAAPVRETTARRITRKRKK